MKLKYSELVLMKGLAKDRFLGIAAEERLDGSPDVLTHGDRLAIAYFEASIRMLVKLGYLDGGDDLEVDREIPDSDPEAEDSDWFLEEQSEE